MFFDINVEFEKNPELKMDDIDQIQEWARNQAHLPIISDEQMVMFLHRCYYDLDATKTLIENFFTIRTHAPVLFSSRDPFGKDVQEALKTMYVTKLPGKTSEGYDVFYLRFNRTQPEFYVMADVMKTYHMRFDIWNAQNGTSTGHVFVFDMQGLSLGHVAKFNTSVIKKNSSYLQNALPVRLKGMHIVNTVPFVNLVKKIVLAFLSPEMKALIQFHQPDSTEIYEHIPKSMFPKESGGDGESISVLQDKTKKLLEDNAEWFKKEELLRVDESKRQEKEKKSNGLFKKFHSLNQYEQVAGL